MEIIIAVLVWLGLLGVGLGSFAACQAWRLRLKHQGKPLKEKRSVCLECGYHLRWYDNIPIWSWVSLRGRCRKCRTKIGLMELVAEVGLMMVFVLIGARMFGLIGGGCGLLNARCGVFAWPWAGGVWLELILFGLLLIILTMLWVAVLYDGKWGELPVKVLVFAAVLAVVYFGLKSWNMQLWSTVWGVVGALIILPGVYYGLYKLSGERLVGGGDWLLALVAALVVGDWWLALLVLFVANLLASLVGVPLLIFKKRRMLYFGPFLMGGLALVLIFEPFLLLTW